MICYEEHIHVDISFLLRWMLMINALETALGKLSLDAKYSACGHKVGSFYVRAHMISRPIPAVKNNAKQKGIKQCKHS